MTKPVARLTTPAEMVASLPLWLGYVPTESLVVVCCHEPRGRVGLTMRYDLPAPDDEPALVAEVEQRVRAERATRVLITVYTDEPNGLQKPRTAMVDGLREAFADLIVTEASLVRGGRFWSYVCSREACCPAAGTPVDAAQDAAAVRLIDAERVLEGRAVMPSRAALEGSLAGPSFLAAELASQRCEAAAVALTTALHDVGVQQTSGLALAAWSAAVERWRTPPGELGAHEAASLAVSLIDRWVRDALADCPERDAEPMLALLAELCRRTPAPYDAAVCTLYAWVTYCHGAGAEVTIALERALRSDPDYSMAHLLMTALQGQVSPELLRQVTRQAGDEVRRQVS